MNRNIQFVQGGMRITFYAEGLRHTLIKGLVKPKLQELGI